MTTDALMLDFPACIAREFPDVFPAAWGATEDILGTLDGVDFSPLARHSRGLQGYEWSAYHRCNVVRAVRVATLMCSAAPAGGRVLDVGAYFGNFALTARRLGFAVHAIDSYRAYAPAMDRVLALMHSAGVTVSDFADTGHDLGALPPACCDVVLCLGVIEHVPHSPRSLLDGLVRVLAPGGLLVLDTPNLAYLYKREALAAGRSVFPPIADQFLTEPPFEGHHREYTAAEIQWMLAQVGLEAIAVELFDFSVYALARLEGDALEKHRRMRADPELRELILASAMKPRA